MRTLGIFLIFLSFIVTGCYDDKGNYNYEDIDAVGITNFIEKDLYFTINDSLIVTPRYIMNAQDLDPDPERFEFKWYALPTSVSDEKGSYLIGEEKDLRYQIELPIGEYLLKLVVTDHETRMVWSIFQYFHVWGEITEGWMFLVDEEDEEGNRYGQLYISTLDDSIPKLYENMLNVAGLPLEFRKGPRQIHSFRPMNEKERKTYIVSDGGVVWLEDKTFNWSPTQILSYEFFDDIPNGFTVNSMKGYAVGHIFAIADSSLYLKVLGSSGAIFNPNIAYLGALKLHLAPFVGGALTAVTTENRAYAIFDKKTRRFFMVTMTSAVANDAKVMEITNDHAKTGRDLIYMQDRLNAEGSYALLKDRNTRRVFEYSLKYGNASVDFEEPKERISSILADVDPSMITYDYQYKWLYYIYNNKLYTYSEARQQDIKIKDFTDEVIFLGAVPANDKQRESIPTENLVVATLGTNSVTGKEETTVKIFLTQKGAPDKLEDYKEVKIPGRLVSVDYTSTTSR